MPLQKSLQNKTVSSKKKRRKENMQKGRAKQNGKRILKKGKPQKLDQEYSKIWLRRKNNDIDSIEKVELKGSYILILNDSVFSQTVPTFLFYIKNVFPVGNFLLWKYCVVRRLTLYEERGWGSEPFCFSARFLGPHFSNRKMFGVFEITNLIRVPRSYTHVLFFFRMCECLSVSICVSSMYIESGCYCFRLFFFGLSQYNGLYRIACCNPINWLAFHGVSEMEGKLTKSLWKYFSSLLTFF